MSRWCIKLMGLANGQFYDHESVGVYVKSYDPNYVRPEGYDGGLLETTPDFTQAVAFDGPDAALAYWHQQAPPPYDIRLDGKPNRPLTAFSVIIEDITVINRQTQESVVLENENR